jgi:site-specific recombinase XerD
MNGKYKNLTNQIDKLFKGNNQKSIKTKYRYRDAAYRFCKWLSSVTNLKKFSNVKAKHIYMYVDHMKGIGYAPGTIMSELSGIRFFYDMTNSKEKLPENSKLNLEKRIFGRVKRAWSDNELEKAITLAESMNRFDVAKILKLGYAFGTRLEEGIVLTTKQVEDALKTGALYLENTKGKNPREVPLKKDSIVVLNYLLEHKESKERIFIGMSDKTHKVKKSIQDWIRNHRNEFQDDLRVTNAEARKEVKHGDIPSANLTMHGTRHAYAQENYFSLIDAGADKNAAMLNTSEKLGHHRKSVTNIYLP